MIRPLAALVAAWFMAVLVLAGVWHWAGPISPRIESLGSDGGVVDGRGWMWIAIGSLIIAIAALAPRLIYRPPADGMPDSMPVYAGFVAGMLVRLAGTVALFLVSSYYLDAGETWIAAWVLFWHIGLLLVEVGSISRLPDRPAR